jgi:hypothetical protein
MVVLPNLPLLKLKPVSVVVAEASAACMVVPRKLPLPLRRLQLSRLVSVVVAEASVACMVVPRKLPLPLQKLLNSRLGSVVSAPSPRAVMYVVVKPQKYLL